MSRGPSDGPSCGPTRGPSGGPTTRPRRPLRSLASRLVALGALQLVLLVLVTAVMFVVAGPREAAHPREYLDRDGIAKLGAAATTSRAALQAALDELRGHRIEVSIYDGERRLVASNVEPALAIPAPRPPPDPRTGFHEPPPGPRPRTGTPRSLVLHLELAGQPGFLVARGVFGEPPGLILPLLILGASFVVLAVTGLLTARWIARPIERLSRTARTLGDGDLTARSRLDRADEIGELGHRIDEMADRLARVLATERELLANVAHELRTPLSRIGVALDLAAEGDADAARTALGEISVDVGELETITDDILTAMRLEVAGGSQLPLRKCIVAPASIAAGAADRFRLRHTERPLEVTVAPALPELHVDAMLVRRVVDNLLANAHKYTPDRAAPIELHVTAAGDRVAFVVRDRGLGIAADDLPRVFTAFFRGDRSRSRESGGVGLGLTLAKRIVEGHGGTIDLASEPGAGTTATVQLPAAA